MVKNQILKIDSVGANALGIAKMEDGKVCFIPYTLPQEICEVQIIEEHNDFCYGKLSKIIERSEKRIEPECKIYGTCGGCNFLHTNYEFEIELKKKILLETLNRIGKINYDDNPIEIDVINSNNRFYYRNNVQIKTTTSGEIGFYAQKTLKVVPFPENKCLLLTSNIQNFINNLDKKYLLFTKGFIIRDGINLYTSHLNYPTDNEYCEYKVNKYLYRVGISDFFQVNKNLLEIFQQQVCNLVEKEEKTIELYGGAGFFSLPIAEKIGELKANEINKRAIRNGILNAKQNNIEKIDFIASDASEFIKKYKDSSQIIVDPPRAGMDKEVVDNIINSKINRIIYISCNPATFSRDYNLLSSSGFSIDKLSMIDNFPATHHIELISVLTRY